MAGGAGPRQSKLRGDPAAGAPLEILTSAEMRSAEVDFFREGNAGFALMETAAAAVAAEAGRMVSGKAHVAVIAGPGNNGGDALIAGAMLREAGHDVDMFIAGDPPRSGDAAMAAARWGANVRRAADFVASAYDLVIDGLFGIGLTRPLSGAFADIVRRINDGGRVLSIDIPSGIAADSGAVMGAAVEAAATVTFHRPKPGHFLYPGRAHCGTLIIADIGLPPTPSACFLNAPRLWRGCFPLPDARSHKYSRGGALIWSGPELHSGAARLAARAALRAGAGAVTLVGDRAALVVHAAQVSAIMLMEADAAGFAAKLSDAKVTAACVGPGGGAAVRAVALSALGCGKPLVLDADALTIWDGRPPWAAVRGPVVLTPHEGEFARLFGPVAADRLTRARAAAAESGCTVVLKGADTVIAAADGRAIVNANAPPWLATAGSGDTLAGILTGLLAQGMPAFEAAAASVWLHGAMATYLGIGLTADDLAGAEFRDILRGVLLDERG